MPATDICFTSFDVPVCDYALPANFTFPFYYEPHPLCVLAAEQLQQHLKSQTDWQYNFGISANGDLLPDDTNASGKMFGVLLVQKQDGELGYLSAFSGKLADKNHLPKFVPPVFDMLAKDSFFLAEQKHINGINAQLKNISSDPKLNELKLTLEQVQLNAETELDAQREFMVIGRQHRKLTRAKAETELVGEALKQLQIEMSRQSVTQKKQLAALKDSWQQKLSIAKQAFELVNNELLYLKRQRKTLSAALQQKLFQQYNFLNALGDYKDLVDIFKPTPNHIPPAGAGECAAPKLLHYAFKHGFKPIAMSEFWWGIAPISEIRQHGNYYASCQSKCEPILGHMLLGLDVDENPLLINPAVNKEIEIIFQDDDMLVINKPADMLSVPGKNIKDSVFTRLKLMFPDATGPLIVHRLDMATSGLMLIALTHKANKRLQQQFINRSIKKCYIAEIDGVLEQTEGFISLPLRGDYDDLPRQLVCFEHGKPAETTWQVISKTASSTKLYLYPKTGRTHQLRMHCAHHLGLNTAIIGDSLYGKKADRLHLHAQQIEFFHPTTWQPMLFSVDSDF
ncbi:pseudouridine synthase [Colwelliaceae bacterium BS250]